MEETPSDKLVRSLRSKVNTEARKLSDGETILSLLDGREFTIVNFDIKEEVPTTSFSGIRAIPIKRISFTADGQELATFFAEMITASEAQKIEILVSRQMNGSLTKIAIYGFYPNDIETGFDEDDNGFQTHYEGSCDYYTVD